MGIALGHAYEIINYFTKDDNKIDKLKKLVNAARKEKKPVKRPAVIPKIPKIVTVNMNWYDYNTTKGKFCQVKSIHGGGKICPKMDKFSTLDLVLEEMKSRFFPNEKNKCKGEINHYVIELCNQRLEMLHNLKDTTIVQYKEKHALKEVKFILRTKKKSRIEILENKISQDKEQSDSDLFQSPLKRKVIKK